MMNLESVALATVDGCFVPAISANGAAVCLSDMLLARAAELRELLQQIELQIDEQHEHAKASEDIDEMQRLTDADPYRWLADAKHAMQSGLMFAERATCQPVGF